ncbi:hypothetical protein OQA88_4223 [Cercophora sp. LCS_1]
MRPLLPTRRAATALCSSCRKRLTTLPFSIVAQPQPQTSPQQPNRCFLSQTPIYRSDSPKPTSEPTSVPTNPQKKPPFYTLFPQTLPLGPPPHGPFSIDVPSLRREFLRLQASAHPDFHHAASGSQSSARRRAEGHSALLNTAFKTLASPLLRAQYLLKELYGVDLESDERGKEGEADPEVLMTVMEAREMIEEAEREEDLDELREANDERIRDVVGEIEGAFERGDVEGVKRETVRLKYWMGVKEGVDNWERGKGVVLEH